MPRRERCQDHAFLRRRIRWPRADFVHAPITADTKPAHRVDLTDEIAWRGWLVGEWVKFGLAGASVEHGRGFHRGALSKYALIVSIVRNAVKARNRSFAV